MKTGRVPCKCQVARKLVILLEVCLAGVLVGARARCVVTFPFLRERDTVDGDVRRSTSFVVRVGSEVQHLRGEVSEYS